MPGMGWLVGAWLFVVAGPVVIINLAVACVVTALIVAALIAVVVVIVIAVATLTGVRTRSARGCVGDRGAGLWLHYHRALRRIGARGRIRRLSLRVLILRLLGRIGGCTLCLVADGRLAGVLRPRRLRGKLIAKFLFALLQGSKRCACGRICRGSLSGNRVTGRWSSR